LVRPDLVFPSTYNDIIEDRPYPFSIPVTDKLDAAAIIRIYRDTNQGTEYDLESGVQSGPFKNPIRFTGVDNEAKTTGYFERTASS